MKTTYKFLTLAGLSAALCLFSVMPATAQHRGGGGGGGGFSGGGGGGGHVSGGGGFSGGGRSSVGFSPRSSSVAPSRSFNGGQRASVSPRGGNFSPRAGFNGRAAVGNTRINAFSASHRGFVQGSSGAGVYGHGGNYGHYGWGYHGGFYYNQGFYGSLYYPFLGLGYGFLPYGYYSFYWGGYPYYYNDGLFYNYDNNQYTVVEPPIGAAINSMPSGAQSIVINGQQYYEKNGVYYQPITKDDGTVEYQVAGKDGQLNTDAAGVSSVAPKAGDIVSKLPADCRKVKLNGATYYVSADGIYYQETRDSNNNKAYVVVGLDNDDPNEKQQ